MPRIKAMACSFTALALINQTNRERERESVCVCVCVSKNTSSRFQKRTTIVALDGKTTKTIHRRQELGQRSVRVEGDAYK